MNVLVVDTAATLLGLAVDVPCNCHGCGAVALLRDTLLRRYGPDRRVAEIYNDGHDNQHCPRCAGPIRLLIQCQTPGASPGRA